MRIRSYKPWFSSDSERVKTVQYYYFKFDRNFDPIKVMQAKSVVQVALREKKKSCMNIYNKKFLTYIQLLAPH